jgi:hypothetical protein
LRLLNDEICDDYDKNPLFTSGLIKRIDAIIVVDSTTTWGKLRKQLKLIDDHSTMLDHHGSFSYVSAGTYYFVSLFMSSLSLEIPFDVLTIMNR